MFEFFVVCACSFVSLVFGVLIHKFFVTDRYHTYKIKKNPVEIQKTIRHIDVEAPDRTCDNIIDLNKFKVKKSNERNEAIKSVTGWSLLWSNENKCFVTVPSDIADLIVYIKKNPRCLDDLKK